MFSECFKNGLIAVMVGSFLVACKREAAVQSSAQHPWFEDITAKTGMNFVHNSGESGSYFMPRSIGSGGALLDFDNDGRLDIYLVHCVPPGSASKNRLYHQESDGHFKDVSEGSGLDVSGYGMGVAVGDVNNDGLPDVLLTEYGSTRLFLNHGAGKFEDVTSSAGIDNPGWGTAASFFDYDRDGWLDLVIANYVDYNPTQKCFDARNVPEFCGPEGFAGSVTRLFHNLGASASEQIRFEDVTVRSGLVRNKGPALGMLCADFDGDHWPDIFIADDSQPNRLFINQRNGTFTEQAMMRGLAFNAMGGTAANMGVGLGDIDGDGFFDLFITHLNWEQPALLKQGPRGLFQDQATMAGFGTPRWCGTGFGTVVADFNQDGTLDVAIVNGGIKRGTNPAPRLAGMDAFWSPYAQRNQLFANDGAGRFRDISEANAAFCSQAAVGRGLACGDIDNDGALDLLIMNTAAPARLLRNVAPDRGHWLVVRAVDPGLGGRDAYGAEVTVRAGTKTWWRLVQPSYSYLVSNDPRVHFGFGNTTKIDAIHVLWPDAHREEFAGVDVDRIITLRKGSGRKL